MVRFTAGEAKRTKRRKTYFESVLNIQYPDRAPEIVAADEPLDINTDKPTRDEV